MFSWKAFRAICSILLLLPLVHVAYLMSRSTMETLDSSPETWTREIEQYARLDAKAKLPTNPIVVVGGQRVKLWHGLENILAPRPVLMRGLGDAIIEDITYHYSRLIGFYQPERIVLLPGQAEFYIRDSKSPQELIEAIQELVALDATHGVTQYFYIFTPIKTPTGAQIHSIIDETTSLLREWAADSPRIVILDANALLSKPDGAPNAGYFRGDGHNLNEHGYLRLAVLLQTQVDADSGLAGRQ